METPREMVSIQRAMAIAGVSRRTIYNWIKLKKLQWKRTAGGNVRIYADSIWREDPESPK